MKGNSQRSRLTKFRWSILLTLGLSLILATQAMAATGEKVEKNQSLIVTAAGYHSVANTSDGQVWYWGGIADVIDGKHVFRDNSPKSMEGLKDVAAIQSSQSGEVILKKDGTVWQWGSNYKSTSKENNDGVTEFPEPKQIKGLSHIVKISASSVFSAIDKDGSVWVWLPGPYFSAPHKLKDITDAEDISVNGDGVLLILKEDGTVFEWAAYDKLKANNSYTASKIKDLKNVVALSSGHGRNHFAIKKDGTVWGWGKNPGGSLGVTTSIDVVDLPTKIEGLSNVSSIVTGEARTLVIKNDGSLWIIGNDVSENPYPLKNGPELRRIDGLKNVTSVAMGYNHAVVATKDGKLWAWGSNKVGQFGDGSFKDSSTPILVPALP